MAETGASRPSLRTDDIERLAPSLEPDRTFGRVGFARILFDIAHGNEVFAPIQVLDVKNDGGPIEQAGTDLAR